MKNMKQHTRRERFWISIAIALLALVAVVPWRVVAQEAKSPSAPPAQKPTAALNQPEKPKSPQQQIIGTWRGGPSGSDELIIEKSGEFVWLRSEQFPNLISNGLRPAGGMAMGRMSEERHPGPPSRAGMMGSRGGSMVGASPISTVPNTYFSGHWNLQDDSTLTLAQDATVPSLRGMPLVIHHEEKNEAAYEIIRLDDSLLRMKEKSPNMDESSAIFFRRVDDKGEREQAAEKLSENLQRLADMAHLNAAEAAAFGQSWGKDKTDPALDIINRIVAARQRKIDFAELFKLKADEAQAYIEVLKLAGGKYSEVEALADHGQLSSLESSAVEKVVAFKIEFQKIQVACINHSRELQQRASEFANRPAAEFSNGLPDPALLASIRMMQKLATLLNEFDTWLNTVVFTSP